MADERDHLKVKKEIAQAQAQILYNEKDQNKTIEERNKLNRVQKKQIFDLARELKKLNNERLQGFADAESSISGLGSMYSNLNTLERQRIKTSLAISDIEDEASGKQRVSMNEMASINQKIAGLSRDDTAQRALLTAEYDTQKGKLGTLDEIGKENLKNLDAQNSMANDFSTMTSENKELLQAQHDVLDGISKTINGTLSTIKTLYGNLQGAIGGLITGLGFAADKIGQVNSELGTTMFQLDGVGRKAGVLSFFFDDAAQNAKDLSAELGDTGAASFELQTNIGLMSKNMGISGTEATKLVGVLSRLNGGSTGVAMDMVATSKEFAKQNGIIPAQLMGDLAASTEEFALFGKDGGKNILEAAGYAAKLGTNMSTLSGIADGLLDFETSITKELELGAMLGKNINLSKARELAYSGDIEGATKETLKQLGGIDAFNRMDYYQKKQTADLLGVSVAELQKMNSNMAKADTIGGVLNSKFSTFNEIVNAGVNSALGTTLKTLGGAVTAAAQMGGSFAQMGFDVKGMAAKLPGIGKFFGGGAPSGPITKGGAPDMRFKANKSPALAKVPKGGGDALGGKGSITKSLGKIKMSSVLKGAAALLIVAAAVFVFGKAVQEFMKVSWSAVGMAVVSMLALVAAVALLGAIMMSGVGAVAILAGAAAMLIVASAVLVLGLGLQAIGTGFEMLGAGIMSLTPNLLAVGASIMGIASLIPVIGIVSVALFALAGSLAYLSIFGTLALPALMGLGIAFAMAGIGVKMMGEGLSMAIGAMTQAEGSITRLAGLVTPLGKLSLILFGLSASIMALGVSMAFLGFAGLPGLAMLAGIAAVSGPIIKLAGILGIGDSGEAGAVEGGTLSEYETTMLDKMDSLIQATSSQRDIYLDKDKVTNIVMDRGDRSAVNKLSILRA